MKSNRAKIDENGVLLRYGNGENFKPKPSKVSDRQQMSVLRAERELRHLATIADHLNLATYARDRIEHSLKTIAAVLALTREQFGMPPQP